MASLLLGALAPFAAAMHMAIYSFLAHSTHDLRATDEKVIAPAKQNQETDGHEVMSPSMLISIASILAFVIVLVICMRSRSNGTLREEVGRAQEDVGAKGR
eukprot:gnl/MRDRNA2_/MRDRNA2_140630_c0_seq1.p1 gnl/MRDRNA2_/MRDRNA2_140630_c0~~gnl/MRDRNA2_/MRDRNA2_140630_c0_seq1.p1  ORF type:complete len:101 (+),score=17.25 gnl/MRDRNA2_/MRDRNA2_140630_c0_seq1:104-406(+)